MRYRDFLELMQFKPKYEPTELVEVSRTSSGAIHYINQLYPLGTAVDNTR